MNDVLLAALAGALRRHVLEQGGGGGGVSAMKSVVWVSLQPFRDLFRPASELPLTWGDSSLGCVYLTLPIDEPDRAARLRATCTRKWGASIYYAAHFD